MPGTLLSTDAEDMYADRLRQHAQSVWDTIANAPQAIATVAQPAFQAASSAAQNIQPIVPSTPAIDPSAVADAQQSLLQHAQGVWDSVQNAAPSPQQAPQPTQPSPQAVDPSAVQDASQRLLQHANDTWQSVGQGLTSAAAPVQQAAQAVTSGLQQATNPTAPDQTTQPTSTTSSTNAPAPDRSMSLRDYARAAAQRAGIDPDIFVAQIQQESGFSPTARSGAGAIGIAQFMPGTAAGMNVDPTDPYAALDAAAKMDAQNLAKYNGDYSKTLAAYNAGGGAVDQYGGVPPYKETQTYVSTILDNAKSAVGGAASAVGTAASGAAQNVQQAASNALPAVSQFGDKQLTAAEAYAACGPAAAVRFAQLYGRNPTLREAVDLAKNVGWSADTGMAGLQSESKLFDDMGIPHRVIGADWQGLAKEASSGNPVTISTPGHYFTADAYNAQTGAFHVGSSGTDLRQGSEWMTPQQMEATMGPLQGGLAADNPNTPGASPLSQKPTGAPSGPIDSTVQAAQQGWQAVGGGLQSIDNAVQSAATQAGTAVSGAAQGAQQAVQGAVQGAQQAVNAAGQAVTDLGAGAQQAVSGALDTARTALQQAADTAGQGLPDVTGTLKPENIPLGGEQSPLGKIAQGQKVTPTEQLEAAPQIALGYEQSRGQAAANLDPLRQLPGGNVIGPTVEQLTDPASWVGVGNVKSAIGVAASVAASVGAQQVAQNLIPDSDPNKGVKVALVSLLGAFTGGPVGERTIAPLVDRADSLISSIGVDGATQLVRRAVDAAGDKVAPAVSQFVSEELGAAGTPADVALQRARQAVEDLRNQFPQMSPGALAASREGKALAALEAESASTPASSTTVAAPPLGRLSQALQGLNAYPEDIAGPIRDWARTTDAVPEDVARTVQQWISENPVAEATASRPSSRVPTAQTESAPPSSTTNPYDLPRAAPQPDAVPLSQDQVLTHLEFLDQLHTQNDARIAELQNRLAAGARPGGDYSGTVVRPPWAVGWTNQGLEELARRNDLNPYEANWWERGNFVPGTGEMREDVGQSGIAGSPQYRGTKLTQQSPTEMRAELARLEAEQPQLLSAQTAIWEHAGQGGDVYAPQAPEGLPFEGGLDAGAAQASRGLAAENAPQAGARGQAEAGIRGAPVEAVPTASAESGQPKLGFRAPDSTKEPPEQPPVPPTGGSESGAMPLTPGALRAGTTVGGAVAGGVAGYATTPDDATWQERAARTLIGAGAGAGLGSTAAGFRGTLPQDVLENLRAGGVVGGGQQSFVPLANAPRGPIARGVDWTKQAMLSNPATHTAYVIGNVLELLRSPAALAMGGRGDDAIAGLTSVARGIPAAADAARAAFQGQSLPTLANVAAPTGGPVYRVLGAVHAFSRTLGEYQGMAQEASRLLREGGLSPNDPDAAAYLAAHSSNIYDAGLRSGAGAVFMRPNTAAEGGNFLENMFRRFNGAKEGMLASPDLKQQALGALMDFAIPFSGIPTQLLKVAANRLPVASQATGAIRAIKAGAAGDMGGMQRAIGETGLESTIQLMIAKQIADGNIAGADDPDHPDSVRVNGTWVDMKDMGGYALPMRVMASWADGYAKGGQNIPAGTPGASPLEQTYNYYGPRFSAALTASMKPFAQAVPGENMMKLLVDMGSGGAAGGVPGVALGLGQNVANRVAIPGIARFAENLSDPVARDIDKKGVDSLWKGPMSNWPGLSGMLPAKIDPTTGQPVAKPSSGLGIFLGAKNDVASPLTIEARRLNDAGFSVTAPKTYPTEVTVAGSKVSLSPDEQRQVAQATGATMDRLATQRLQSPEYQNATDARKALMLKAMITAADNTRTAAVQKVIGQQQWRSRIAAGRNVAGQLVNQAQMPTADDFAGFNPLSGETIGAQRALAGVR